MAETPTEQDERDELHRIADRFSCAASAERAAQRDLDALGSASRIVDVGCGAGAALSGAKARGWDALGIDHSSDVTEDGSRAGLRMIHGDAGEALGTLRRAGETFDGALLSHVIEHLQPADALALLRAIGSVLQPGGRLVVRTPNAKNALVLSEFFWLDPTHVRPYPRALIRELGAAAGFATVASDEDPTSAYFRPVVRRLAQRVRSLVSGVDRSGAMDSVVVLERRPASSA